jgi:hypothetical protein
VLVAGQVFDLAEQGHVEVIGAVRAKGRPRGTCKQLRHTVGVVGSSATRRGAAHSGYGAELRRGRLPRRGLSRLSARKLGFESATGATATALPQQECACAWPRRVRVQSRP